MTLRLMLLAITAFLRSGNALAAGDYPDTIEIFTTTGAPIGISRELSGRNVQITTYLLDAPRVFSKEISKGLPSDPKKAREAALRLLRRDGEDLARRASMAWAGAVKAKQYGIRKLPAFVFDGTYLVEGIANLPAAISTWRKSE
jgi:integrating conjugative element protein (TIGR03757 family)